MQIQLNYYYKFSKVSFAVKSYFDTLQGQVRSGQVRSGQVGADDGNADNKANSAQFQVKLPTGAELGKISVLYLSTVVFNFVHPLT